ncbi:Glycosyl transferase 4-like [Vibrio sp. B1REV9]|uniref:glycosyltransferase n=1 Tax=Vibrio sp. B1REV9 TaxID=2751179 RepID=UPI001AF1524B|nr:glycosyltransferase [Vibrio sp. B1REV9]CAE6881005.1 Glycosyl transferase 4-like [Vibrio sp. B1REV9]CAE6965082.1 Glycosyl transferase 4-like [Vibrio sp. B1REV9]
MNILFVVTGLGMGGAENLVINLADFYVDKGYRVTIVYLTGDIFLRPNSKEVDIVSLEMFGYKDIFSGYMKLRRLIFELKPDVVHSHMIHANLLSRLVNVFPLGPKLICTAHSTNEGGYIRMLAYRFTDRFCDMFTNVSNEAADVFIAKGAARKGRIIAIPNGINANIFYPRHSPNRHDKIRLIAVGRLCKEKDYPNLLRAISKLKIVYPQIHLKIVGDGSLKSELNSLVDTLEIKTHVSFLGTRKDVAELISDSDIFVLSSEFEGFGLAVAEAMACEKVVVATDCGGVREVVGDCGFLVEPKNSVWLAEKITEAIELSSASKKEMGINARRRVLAHYSLDSAAEKYIALYSNLVKGDSPNFY